MGRERGRQKIGFKFIAQSLHFNYIDDAVDLAMIFASELDENTELHRQSSSSVQREFHPADRFDMYNVLACVVHAYKTYNHIIFTFHIYKENSSHEAPRHTMPDKSYIHHSVVTISPPLYEC